MNTLKKCWCRSYQFCLKAAIPLLPYHEPRILSSVSQLPGVLTEAGIHSVLLITDAGIRSRGLTRPLENLLAESGIHCAVYDQTVANPTSRNVEEARQIYLQEDCQAIIGFGGGSSIDCAKGTGARIARPRTPLSEMEGILKVHCSLPMLIAIPTTAGTGSEVTVAAVITDSKTHHKYAITDFFLIPRIAVHDPELTSSLPGSLTASTALDALTHAVEAYIGRSTTRDSRENALKAVSLIFKSLDSAYTDGGDLQARADLLEASYLAGQAFSKSYVGYVHAIAHSLSGKYNLPHGYTNAVLLPWVLEAYGGAIHGKLRDLAVAAGIASPEAVPSIAAAAFIRAIRNMNRRYGIPCCFREIREEDIPMLAATADREANPLYPVPVLMDQNQLAQLYKQVMTGYHGVRMEEIA